MFKIIFLLFLANFCQSAVYNYCNQELCVHSGHRHITCGSSGDFSPSCSWDANIVDLTKADQKKILSLHNKFRNRIAGGEEEGFGTAVRMTTMEWSTDLADYAGLNVRRCKFQHDCHNSPEMKNSGQNLFFTAKTDTFEHNIASFIDTAIASWWNEREEASPEDIDTCCGDGNAPHFLLMMHERANRIGCAISQFQGPKGKTTYLVCNYSVSAVSDKRIYESGETASKCKSGVSEEYESLCSEAEEVDWNKVEEISKEDYET